MTEIERGVTKEVTKVDLAEVRNRAVAAARAAAAKVGLDTLVLDVGAVLAITDYFVITSAANPRQVRTIAKEVEARLGESAGVKPLRIEGLDDARWVLLDYGDFVVHVFLEEVRRYYDIERLWSDSPTVKWQDEAEGDEAEARDDDAPARPVLAP